MNEVEENRGDTKNAKTGEVDLEAQEVAEDTATIAEEAVEAADMVN